MTRDPGDEPVVELDGAAVRRGGRTVWSDVSLRIGRGELVAVLGPNGVGKSTLLQVLLGGLRPTAGRVRVLGSAPGAAGRRIGYVPQRRSYDPSARIRGRDVVRLGWDGDRWGLPLPARVSRASREARQRVDDAVELVGATGYADRPIGECSGGEQQRLLIAQALVRRPELLLLDEPLDSLDVPHQAAVSRLLREVCRRDGVTVVLVAHDVNPLLDALDTVVYLGAGGAAAGRPEEVVTAETLSRLYDTPVEVLRASDGRLVVVGQPDAAAPHEHA